MTENTHEWHVAINQKADELGHGDNWPHFMYLGKELYAELHRLPMLFKAEREGTLPKIHRQCSHSQPEEVIDNHLTCCLGQTCKTCPFLVALDSAKISDELRDVAKAHTCAAHILEQPKHSVDTSEGFILTTDDRMFWHNVYSNLAAGDSSEDSDRDNGDNDA